MLAATIAAAQPPAAQPAAPLTLQAAMDRALTANPALIAARLRRAVDEAGIDVARERLNPELRLEFQRETPTQGYGAAWPLELGGKRNRRIALGEATLRSGE